LVPVPTIPDAVATLTSTLKPASRPIDLKTTLALEYRLTSLCDAKVDLLIRRTGEVEKPIHVIARQGAPL
jgi:hypothetical protein